MAALYVYVYCIRPTAGASAGAGAGAAAAATAAASAAAACGDGYVNVAHLTGHDTVHANHWGRWRRRSPFHSLYTGGYGGY